MASRWIEVTPVGSSDRVMVNADRVERIGIRDGQTAIVFYAADGDDMTLLVAESYTALRTALKPSVIK